MRFIVLTYNLAFVLMLVAPGCDKPVEKAHSTPTVAVELPPSPRMVEPTFVERYTDGSFTVAGIIKGRKNYLGKSVKVKGYVQTVQQCKVEVAPCDPPEHLVLVDDLGKPYKRLVVLAGEPGTLGRFKPDQAITVSGAYLQSDPQGLFVRMEGVLVMKPTLSKSDVSSE